MKTLLSRVVMCLVAFIVIAVGVQLAGLWLWAWLSKSIITGDE